MFDIYQDLSLQPVHLSLYCVCLLSQLLIFLHRMVLLVLVICGRCSLCIALSSNRFFESLQLVVSHLLASGVRLGAIHLSFLPFTWNLGFGFSGSAWLQFRACELITVSRFGRLRCHFYTSHMFFLWEVHFASLRVGRW